MLDKLQKTITEDLAVVNKIKDKLNAAVQQHRKWDTELRLGIMRYCLMQDKFPERLKTDTDDVYLVRLQDTRRRLVSEITLGKCLLIALEAK